MKRDDIELDFIREFAHSGANLGSIISREDRRERIRIAILKEKKQDLRFRDTPLTYAQTYRLAYNKPIDLRRFPRDEALEAAGALADLALETAKDHTAVEETEDWTIG